jgi:hypothetical protein
MIFQARSHGWQYASFSPYQRAWLVKSGQVSCQVGALPIIVPGMASARSRPCPCLPNKKLLEHRLHPVYRETPTVDSIALNRSAWTSHEDLSHHHLLAHVQFRPHALHGKPDPWDAGPPAGEALCLGGPASGGGRYRGVPVHSLFSGWPRLRQRRRGGRAEGEARCGHHPALAGSLWRRQPALATRGQAEADRDSPRRQ